MYKHILYSFFCAALYFVSGCNNNDDVKKQGGVATIQLPNLVQNYINTSKDPFGGYVAYQQLQAMYTANVIRDKKQNFIKTWDDISYIDTASLYVLITPNLWVNSDEINAMLDYVSAGNDLFISAGYIDEEFLSRVGALESFDVSTIAGGFNEMSNTSIQEPAPKGEAFSYYYLPFKNYFSYINKTDTRVLGVDQHDKPNFIVHFHGKGRLFLQCDVRAFSNYFLLTGSNYKYMETALSYTRGQPSHLYWDDYYNRVTFKSKSSGSSSGGSSSSKSNDDQDDFSTMSEISKSPALWMAFWLLLILVLLFILYNAKRKQRIIKVIKPNENSTVNFTETVGRLYLQKKDNKNVADKMITYFNEYIRNNYFLNTGNINEDFITTLSRKSGVQRDKVDALYRTIQHTQQSAALDDYQILSLNELIQNFYKTKN